MPNIKDTSSAHRLRKYEGYGHVQVVYIFSNLISLSQCDGDQVAYNPIHCLEIRGQGIKNSIKVLFNPHPNAVTSL